MGKTMTRDALDKVEYRDSAPACLFGASGDALDRMRRTAESAGCRIAGAILIQADPTGFRRCAPAAPALIELDDADEDAGVLELLDWAQREAAVGARRTVVSAPQPLIDLVAARTWHDDVAHLCEVSEAERVASVTLASRRPPARLHDIGRDDGSVILQQLSEDVGRIAAILASLSEEEALAVEGVRPAEIAGKDEPGLDAVYVRSLIRARRLRDQFIRGGLFADPAWDMLLDLMAARLEDNRVAVSSLCIAAAVPATTALRWIKALTDRGLFVRAADPQDGRRVYIELSDEAARALTAYLRAVQRIAPTAI